MRMAGEVQRFVLPQLVLTQCIQLLLHLIAVLAEIFVPLVPQSAFLQLVFTLISLSGHVAQLFLVTVLVPAVQISLLLQSALGVLLIPQLDFFSLRLPAGFGALRGVEGEIRL